jgi:transposase
VIQGCMSGIPEATQIILNMKERAELEGLARSTRTEHRLRQRARIVLLAADGTPSRAIGRAVGCTTGTASKWRVRYAEKWLAGLDETGNRGAKPKYTAETGKRILVLLDQPPPAGHARWSGPLLATEVATGKVMAAHKNRRRRLEFLDFMNVIVAAYPDTAIHVVLDNLNTHKPKNDRWLLRHPNVHFHFTPTRASWLTLAAGRIGRSISTAPLRCTGLRTKNSGHA